ncbi:MAG: hypothetical protein GY940_09880, partial [bacterium]|nr:hypothetical protein [bacterium]
YYGYYNKGPRARRGGLAGGWSTRKDGHILKITGTKDKDSRVVVVQFPIESRILTANLLFRAWVKISKGAVDLGSDVGCYPRITRAMSEAAPDGWYFINTTFHSSHITSMMDGWSFTFKCMGELQGNAGEFEIYLALPYLANIEKDDSPHWSPSTLDILSDYGTTIDPETRNVGIGTTTPSYTLHTNGTSYANYRAALGADYAEYFESKNGKTIPPGNSVVLEGGKIRKAKKGETPFGIISANPIIAGGVHV